MNGIRSRGRLRIVAALGGNALLQRGEPAEAATQVERVREAVASLATVAERHDLILTHGNGPQVGLLALEQAAYRDVAPYPLDFLVADTQGMIGYPLTQALRSRLPHRQTAAVLTQVVVNPRDPAFQHPTKPVGPIYREEEAGRLAAEHGWQVAADGRNYRRVVPSPEPCEIVEIDVMRGLMESGTLVICCGGGGIPVVRSTTGLCGIEAVIDKDLTAALLARELRADLLLILTDVPCVMAGWGTDQATPIGKTTVEELRELDFASGSMGPKILAACRFAETGGRAAIGLLSEAARLVDGDAGTQIRRDRSGAPALATPAGPVGPGG
jgi:carbamate kinase